MSTQLSNFELFGWRSFFFVCVILCSVSKHNKSLRVIGEHSMIIEFDC